MAEYEIPLKVGDSFDFAKTISESDVYLFAGITGDFSPMHTNEAWCQKESAYGTRVVHGDLTFCLAATASTLLQEKLPAKNRAASYGYDHLRFVKPVFFGDTINAHYEVMRVEPDEMKTYATCTLTNQHGEVVCVCDHILKFFKPED